MKAERHQTGRHRDTRQEGIETPDRKSEIHQTGRQKTDLQIDWLAGR